MSSHSWLSTDVSANRCINTYLKGFLDISGGDLYLRHGQMGIGTTAPTYPLDVRSYEDVAAFRHSFLFYWYGGDTHVINTNRVARKVTIKAEWDIWAGGTLMSSSDERIKTNIQEIPDDNALSTLRLIQPKTYEYKEHIVRGNHTTYGFIAQQIKEVIPHAVSLHSKSIPNIYTIAEVSATNEIYNVITFTDFDTANLDVSSNSIVVMDMENKEHDVTITDVIDSNSIRVDSDLSEWMGDVDASGNIIVQGTKIFVYGQKVDDFHTLHKDAIFTVATAALQEVDRQLQAEKSKTVALETKVATMESQITDLLARVTALESA